MTPTTAPLIDAHHHLWDLGRRPQPWLDDPALATIRRTFTPDDLRTTATQLIAGRRLHSTVAVQCVPDVPETEDLLALAEWEPLIGAVVGWADLTSPGIGDLLDGLLAGPGGTFLRSLRHLVQGETDPGWLQRPDVENGLAAVRDRGLCYDVLVRSHQLDQAIRLAERFPDLPQVLDHAGKPPIADGELADWEHQLCRLAAHPQVVCKVSGLITEADHERWTVDDIRPVWDVLLSAFGPDRLMFGSDWPVANLAGGWNRWAATVDELLDGCSADETSAILAGTATTFYRLTRTERDLGSR
ncbi:amidohydrolase family protein [Streptomyces sp. S1A1-8]|uniref:amidohydrolase family protein n=1 Tax=unclassified Streptomyces TaxID=2593676 RepID=UPI001165A544|nr:MULTISPECIES: amidohydrolase family protein [unclassified Streptomyces]QDN95532.1 amidohydrolase family protein [Streptomyces sp. RLB1-9]QDO05824.1 amidohydrolase family protein [Streptomyces sp. S1D4-23]QDO17254.1 amidohydrolase family protein [Streptomyces sp. S1A1-8]QDO27377.1 amidohydrolase family protein [Streptomyces sp. S1A1-3]